MAPVSSLSTALLVRGKQGMPPKHASEGRVVMHMHGGRQVSLPHALSSHHCLIAQRHALHNSSYPRNSGLAPIIWCRQGISTKCMPQAAREASSQVNHSTGRASSRSSLATGTLQPIPHVGCCPSFGKEPIGETARSCCEEAFLRANTSLSHRR